MSVATETAPNRVYIKPNRKLAQNQILYDLETLPFDFTFACYYPKQKMFFIYANTVSSIDENEVTRILIQRFAGIVDAVAFYYDESEYRRMRRWILYGGQDDGMYRSGWNIKHFDIPVLYCMNDGQASTARRLSDDIIVQRTRLHELRDDVGSKIQYRNLKSIISDWYTIDIALLNEKSGDTDQTSKERTPASLKQVSAYAGLDVLDNELTRIDFNNWTETSYDELDDSLKKYINPDSSLTTLGLTELIVYNAQDTINQGFLFNEEEYIKTFQTKSNLLIKHKVNAYESLANASDTSARISSLILTENDRDRYHDIDGVNFDFPMPDGSTVDLLDQLYQNKIIPPVVHDYYETLRGIDVSSYDTKDQWLINKDKVMSYDYIKGDLAKRALTAKLREEPNIEDELAQAPVIPHEDFYTAHQKVLDGKQAKPSNATLTVPYFDKNLNPIDSYNTFSVGGAHGATSFNAHNFPFKEARMLKARVKRDKINGMLTVDYENYIEPKVTDFSAWAIDVGSFYPSFLVLLGVYRMLDGTDVYNDIRLDRLALKKSLPEKFEDYTDKDWDVLKQQLDAKLILNSVSGASNTMSPYALLPLDNRIASMRVMGNLFIYMIATFYVRELGAQVLSTNTDGIEITFDHLPENQRPDAKQINALADRLTEQFGFTLEPERLTRFVNKDSNNRIEWHGTTINKVSGKLGKGFNKNYHKGEPARMKLDSKLDHPRAVDMAVLEYIDDHKDFLNPAHKVIKPTKTRPITQPIVDWFEDWLKMYARGEYFDLPFDPRDWLLFTKGSRSRRFYADGELLQETNRHIYVTFGGRNLVQIFKEKESQITGWTSNYTRIVNTTDSLNQIMPDELDYHAYAVWAYNTLLVWVNAVQTRPDTKAKTGKVSNIKRPRKPRKKAKPKSDEVANITPTKKAETKPAITSANVLSLF